MKKINGKKILVVNEKKQQVWLDVLPNNFVSIYKHGESKKNAVIVLPSDSSFVVHVDPNKRIVYVAYAIAKKHVNYVDYPTFKDKEKYLILKMTSNSFEVISDSKFYKHIDSFRSDAKCSDEKGCSIKNKNYEFYFSLEVCT